MVEIEATAEVASQIVRSAWSATWRSSAADRGKPLTLGDKVLLGHLDDPETQDLEIRAAATSRCGLIAWCFRMCWARAACCSSCRHSRDRVAVPTTIHCDHLIQARTGGERGPARGPLTKAREVYRFPAHRRGEIWLRVLGAWRRHHPSGRAGELRVSWRADHRYRLPHAECRWPGCLCRRRRRSRRGRGHRRPAVGVAVSRGISRCT